MTKFATRVKAPKAAKAAGSMPTTVIKIKASAPPTVTFEGGEGVERKAKSELFLLAVVNMVSEKTFYEDGKVRDARFVDLIHKVAAKDPDWVARFVPYLRNQLNMRTASVVMAAEYVKSGAPNGRKVVASALQRADEPSVLVAYWHQNHGKNLPQPIKRGIADAITERLYNQRSLVKWDADGLSPRFGDVIELVHPKPTLPWMGEFFRFAMAKRHNREDLARDTEQLDLIRKYRDLMALPVPERRALVEKAADTGDFEALNDAGLTWESLSGWLQGPMDAKAWTAIIPQMGYMALLRNLRNFDDAKISEETRNKVIAKLTDPEEVAKSRQLPIRFYSAYKNVASVNWTAALEKGLELTLGNVPSLSGKTLILVDTSGSMDAPFSAGNRGTRPGSGEAKTAQRWELAALFGAALAVRAEKADLVYFQSDNGKIDFRTGGSVLRTIEQFKAHVGGGTNTWQAFANHYGNHDRVVIITDEQAHPGSAVSIPGNTYILNLAGYSVGIAPADKERTFTFGGLSDSAFGALAAIESMTDHSWPF